MLRHIFFKVFLRFFAQDISQEIYRGILDREADLEGLKAYSNTLRKELNLSEILSNIVLSDEFNQKYTSLKSVEKAFTLSKDMECKTPSALSVDYVKELVELPIESLPDCCYANEKARSINGFVYFYPQDREHLVNLRILFHGEHDPEKLNNVKILLHSIPSTIFIAISSHNQQIHIEKGCTGTFIYHLFGDGAKAKVGHNTTSNGFEALINENGYLEIGHDCMFAAHITFHVGDNHAIFDLATNKILNHREKPRIVIEDHVWVGQRSSVIADCTIGKGSVIATGTIIKGEVAPRSLVAGNPGRIIKSNISWTRSYTGEGSDIIKEMFRS